MILNPNLRITISVLFVLIVTFSTLMILPHIVEANPITDTQKFFKNNFLDKSTVFLLGSSHVGVLDAEKINDYISDETIEVYNLAMIKDNPEKRLTQLDSIISSKPEVVLYGISYRDFAFFNGFSDDLGTLSLQSSVSLFLKSTFGDFFPSNPQFTTKLILKEIGSLLSNDSKNIEIQKLNSGYKTPLTPFFIYVDRDGILTDDELIQNVKNSPPPINPQANSLLESKTNIMSLNRIITKLQNNDIKIILFTTPLHPYYLDSIDEQRKINFQTFLDNLSKEYDIPIYKFEEKYSDLDIWNDANHITHNSTVSIFSNDIAKIIQSEIKK
jgi:hypothetical protein